MKTEYTIATTSSSGVFETARGNTPAAALRAANTQSKFVNAQAVTGDTIVYGRIVKTGNRVEFHKDI